jgi:hypothetical protein
MVRLAIIAIIFVMLSSVPCPLRAQQPLGALIGTTDSGRLKQHLYVVAFPIVERVARAKSNLVSRIFISNVTNSDCCNPICLGGDCFQCCDSSDHIVCTQSALLGYILGRINAVSESDWEKAQGSGFKEVAEWTPISSLLKAKPVQEISANTPDAMQFWSRMRF